MGQLILTRRKRVFVFILVIAALGGLGLASSESLPENNSEQQLRYSSLVTHQLVSEWGCLPNTTQAHEDFIMRIMRRFMPDDFRQLESGRTWMRDYQSKQANGTLTVEERRRLHDAYEKKILPWRTDVSELDQRVMNSANLSGSRMSLSECVLLSSDSCRKGPDVGSFMEPSCISCQQPIISFSVNPDSGDVRIYYENDVVKWNPSDPPDFIRSEQKPVGMVMGEYSALQREGKLSQAIAALEEQKQHDDTLKSQAQDAVMKMNAADVSPDAVEAAVKKEHLRLKCDGRQ